MSARYRLRHIETQAIIFDGHIVFYIASAGSNVDPVCMGMPRSVDQRLSRNIVNLLCYLRGTVNGRSGVQPPIRLRALYRGDLVESFFQTRI